MEKVKLKFINKKLLTKITAFTLAGTMAITGSNITAIATDKKDSDMCMEVETILDYKAVGKSFKATKYGDNSILVEVKNGDNYDSLKINANGKVEITTYESQFFNISKKEKKETFTIDYFDGERLDIDTSCIKSDDLKKCVNTLKKYVNSNQLIDRNYIAEFGDELIYNTIANIDNDYVKELAKKQYGAVQYEYMNDLNDAGFEVSSANAGALAITSGILAESGGEITGLSITAPEVALFALTLLAFYELGEYISDSRVLSIDDIGKYTYEDSDVDISDNTKWATIDVCLDKIEDNYSDDNQDNDYYRAVISGENNVYINFANPMSMDEAANLLKTMNNIYTYEASDAINVISAAGGIASNGRDDPQDVYTNLAENHAFKRSFDSFDPTKLTFDKSTLKLKDNVQPGVYYWHFHFKGKKLGGIRNPAHVFFGLPIVITQTDINNLSANGNNLSFTDIENYMLFDEKFKKYESLIKIKKGQ